MSSDFGVKNKVHVCNSMSSLQPYQVFQKQYEIPHTRFNLCLAKKNSNGPTSSTYSGPTTIN